MASTQADSKKRFSGKVAIVTASTEGIGFAIARGLGREGASVIVSSRKKEKVDKAVTQLQAENIDVLGLVCHVGNAEDRKNLIQETIKNKGGIDILVSNAAVNPTVGPILDTPEAVWDKIFEINVKCAFLLTKECVPHMKKRGHGSIVFVSSIAGYNLIGPIPVYSISKTALLGLTKAIAIDCAPHNIRVNCIAPGIIKTKFSEYLTSSSMGEEALVNIPLRRFGEASDCAGLVSFLCSEDASYITGETIVVAGGMISRL